MSLPLSLPKRYGAASPASHVVLGVLASPPPAVSQDLSPSTAIPRLLVCSPRPGARRPVEAATSIGNITTKTRIDFYVAGKPLSVVRALSNIRETCQQLRKWL